MQEKYGDKGFKLIVVSVQSDGNCSQPPQWNPDKIVCDYDGKIADAWHANDLPQAFLWSWQGNMLVAHGTVDNVATAVENYFKKIPRVYVEEESDENIYRMVRYELIKNAKIEVVANEEERKALAELRRKSATLNYDSKLRCKLGEEISANSRLVISEQKRGKKDVLVLELFSVEKGCLTASGTAALRGNIETEVAEAVYNLLKNLLGTVSMPGKNDDTIKPKQQDWEIAGGEETIVNFKSVPAGAAVIADGKLLCKSTPCSKVLKTGNHKIQMQMEDDCFLDSESTIAVKRDQPNTLSMTLSHRESAVKVYAQDENGNDISADVFVDDKLLGKTPDTFKVPLCSRKLLVSNGIYKHFEELSLKEKQVKTIQAKLESKNVEQKSETSDEFSIKQRMHNLLGNLNLDRTGFFKIAGVVFLLVFGIFVILSRNNRLDDIFGILIILLTLSALAVWITNFFTDIGFSSLYLWIADIICLVIIDIYECFDIFKGDKDTIIPGLLGILFGNGIILLIVALVIWIVNLFTDAGTSSQMFWIIGSTLFVIGFIKEFY